MKESAFGPLAAADCLDRLRRATPRVHCITNSVAESFTANALLAAGAVPSMTTDPEEVPEFVSRADALLVNLGTLDPLRRAAIDAALDAIARAGRLWALDPVFVDRSAPRLDLARRLVAQGPAVVRGNRAELAALAGATGSDQTIVSWARDAGTTAAMTGDVDLVSDGTRAVRVANGHGLMARVTAIGCATTALTAGFLSVESDPLAAAAACLAFVGVAGERAGAVSAGPGSFVPAFLDALHAVTPEDISNTARIS